MGVLSLRRKIQLLQPRLMDFMEETLNQLEEEIVKLNQEQLAEGQRSDGTLLPKYAPQTMFEKLAGGRTLLGERIALYDLGDFWNSMFVLASYGSIEFSAKDRKTDMLVEIYGEAIFGLSDIQKEALAELARPILYEKIINFLKSV